MTKIISLLLLLAAGTANAQKQKPETDSASKIATVNVTVMDMKAKPRPGEEVIFMGEKSGKKLTSYSNSLGKIKQLLPPGDNYRVSVKSITDTSKYSIVSVPSLADDEYFTEPYWVNIKFDPPRHFRLDNVHFDIDKSTLRADSYPQLTELFDYLQRHEDEKIEIGGHTDNAGNDAHNLKLSQDRANTIREYLIQKGIKAIRLTAKGYGASLPVADNSTEEGRQLNRRTEVKIL